MKMKQIATATLLASVALSPMSPISAPARADGKDVVAGLIIGGIIGSAVTKDNYKKKSTKSTKASAASSAERTANVEVQTALNYFGYSVGTPDGAIGPKSRAAISEYQAFLGYPATGDLTENERSILVTAYQRALAGGPVIAEAVAGSVHGLKAVLITQRDDMAGVAPGTTIVAGAEAPAPGSVAAAAAAALPKLIGQDLAVTEVAVTPEPEVVAEPEVVVAAVEAEPALPSFMDPAGAKGALSATCNEIGVTTNANGGMATADTMSDANFALSEQFCLARTSAITTSDALAAKIAGFSADQIAEQCAAFGPVLKDHVAALSLKPAGDVLPGVESFIISSGMSPAQLSGTAKVCLGVGYAQDDMNVAIGSALLLAAMGEKGYSEFLGHHLSQGFGATQRPDLAMDWYQMSIDAMGQGQMVVAPGVEGRDDLILKASFTINGRADELAPLVQEAALPVFEVVPEDVAEVATEVAAADATDEVITIEEANALIAAELPMIEEEVAAEVAAAGTEVEAVMEEMAVVAEVAPELIAPELVAPEAVMPMEPDTTLVTTGAQFAIMAARLPLMIFTAY
jgi:peptidoglycan hydrolase-like protein with peptidoglycan-binding domain